MMTAKIPVALKDKIILNGTLLENLREKQIRIYV